MRPAILPAPSESSEARAEFPIVSQLTSTCQQSCPFLTDVKVISSPSGCSLSFYKHHTPSFYPPQCICRPSDIFPLLFYRFYRLDKKQLKEYLFPCLHPSKNMGISFEYTFRRAIKHVFHCPVFQPFQPWLPGHRPAAPHSDRPPLAAAGNIANASAKKL